MDIVDITKRYTYEEYTKAVYDLMRNFGGLIHVFPIGITHMNRTILAIKMGFGERSLLFTGGVHGRESINPIVLLKVIEEHASHYYTRKLLNGMNIEWVFRKCSFIFVPLVNPDGYIKALFEGDVTYNTYKENGNGIDINRNFSSKSFKPTLKMPEPDSEPETKALIKLMNSIDSYGYIDFHSRGNAIYYYRNMMSDSYNVRQLEIAQAISEMNQYELMPPDDEIEANDSGGNTVHYYSEHTNMPALTVETIPDEEGFPLNPELGKEVLRDIIHIPVTLFSMNCCE